MSETLGEKLTAATPIAVLGVGLLALFLRVEWWWMVFVFGWVVLTPLVAILFDTDSEVDEAVDEYVQEQVRSSLDTDAGADGPADRQDALDLLRERYAAGELDEAEFERKVERLLETETLEEAEALFADADTDADADPALDR